MSLFNKACPARQELGAFFGAGSEFWWFPVLSPFSPQPPVLNTVEKFNTWKAKAIRRIL
jgi:hypothetical protein